MKHRRRNRPPALSPNASSYDLSDPEDVPPAPDSPPRVGAWLGLCGAILGVVAMILPWAAGWRGAGGYVPMLLLFSPVFFAPAIMLGSAIAVGVACGRAVGDDPLNGAVVRPAGRSRSLAQAGALLLGLYGCNLVVDLFGNGVSHLGVGAYCFLVAATLCVVGVVGVSTRRY